MVSEVQFGFKPGFRCKTVLMNLTDYIISELNHNNFVFLV